MLDETVNTSCVPFGPRKLLCHLAGSASDSNLTVEAITLGARIIQYFAGEHAAAFAQEKAVNALGLSMYSTGVTDNLHSCGLRMRLWDRQFPFARATRLRPRITSGRLRIGFVGELTYTGDKIFKESLSFPDEHELHVYATRAGKHFPPKSKANVLFERHPICQDANATTPRRIFEKEFYAREIRALAAKINAAELDMLILAYFRHDELSDLANLVSTPCITSYLYGPRPCFHPRVDYSFFLQRHRSFPLMGNRFQSIFTGKALPAELCCPTGYPLYDDWGIDIQDNPPLQERPPVILFHGNLAKLHSISYLSLLVDFLKKDRDLRFKFLGFGDYLPLILDFFSKHGLADRVEYLGEVDKALLETDEFKLQIMNFLRQGRLEPDPWPHGGGSSLSEAWWAGTPTVKMRMMPGDGDLFRPDQVRTDLPILDIKSTTAESVEEFKNLCLKCLYDPDFSHKVLREQYEMARKTVDAARWWNELIASHGDWLTGTGWATGEKPAGGRLGQ